MMQSSLASLWKTAREGHLSPFEQLKALAYREAFLDAGFPEYGLQTKIAESSFAPKGP